MKKDYSVYRFYKGEQKNPFDSEKQNAAYNFWGYESLFEKRFETGNFTPEMWIPANAPDLKEWLSVLNTEPVNKEDLFKLYLFDVLMVRLPEKYQSEADQFSKLYWGTEQ